ncbi:hypothetical protein ACSQ7D_00435 [Capnocytophaga sp. G1920]|uniref:hypothetical protein n=1 Tax=Capnocytophaga TaxID=1016 RepID=UPI00222FA560|nr:hypothetical protein [Capnocytophaga ochracea]UZD35346.1 hypothetical protein OLG90_06520 [Capnocytophaga ochracea]
MKILLTITLSLLLFSCDNSVIGFKKSCNADTAKQTVAELAEVKAKIKQLETLAGNNPTYWVQDSLQQDSKTYYRYQLLSQLPYTDIHLYTFCVAKDDCKQVFLQQKDGSLLPYAEMEKQTKQLLDQQKQFPAFFKQFTTDMAFRQQHLAEPLMRLLVQKDGSVLLTEEELLTDDINALQTYTFSYYPDGVCCKNTEKAIAFVFVPVGDTWRLLEIWH